MHEKSSSCSSTSQRVHDLGIISWKSAMASARSEKPTSALTSLIVVYVSVIMAISKLSITIKLIVIQSR